MLVSVNIWGYNSTHIECILNGGKIVTYELINTWISQYIWGLALPKLIQYILGGDKIYHD